MLKNLIVALFLTSAALACRPQPPPEVAPCPAVTAGAATLDAVPAPALQLEVVALESIDVTVFEDATAAALGDPATEARASLPMHTLDVAVAPPLIIGATTRASPGLWRLRPDRATLLGLHAATRASTSPRSAVWLC